MSKKRKAIGFDFDDILFNFNDTLTLWHNHFHGTNYERKDITTYDIDKLWNCSKEEMIRRVFEFYSSDHHAEGLPVQGSEEGIRELKKDNTLFVITSRPEQFRDVTESWLNKYFPNTFEEIHFTNSFHGIGERRTKGDVCRELGISSFVEDALQHMEALSNSNINVFLYDTPWNQGEVKPPITRVYSWKEIVERLKG